MKITIGKSGGKDVTLDVERLIATRLLIQANSGKGKSWLIRLLAEKLFGKVQVIIVDAEGEFASLREKFGYVLVGKGGNTPADTRSAALVAHKLLELRAPAVCDIYEMKPSQRHTWVKLFLEALIDAPKNLWHPCVIIVDEAHVFCPEKGAGESEAAEAMISLATRGRKRGFCAVFATQRLGKLRKDAAAELVNVLIGGTFIDVDRKRAADTLGVYGKDVHGFFDEVKLLERGWFFALGPAISQERILVKVGSVETTHPEAGSARHAAEPPPDPGSIAKFLPKLADLPKQAEEQARTVAEFKAEIRSLKAQLRARPDPVGVEVKVADPRAIEQAIRETGRKFEKQVTELQRLIGKQKAVLREIAQAAATTQSIEPPKIKIALPELHQIKVSYASTRGPSPVTPVAAIPQAARSTRAVRSIPAENNGNGELTGPELKILKALGELLSIGKEQPPKAMVAAWAGYSPIGGAFGNPLGALRSKGLVDYPAPGVVAFTEAGRVDAGACDPPDQREIHQRIKSICSGPEQKIIGVLLEHGPEEITKNELAERSGYSPIGGAFGNPLGALRTKGLVVYPRPGVVQLADWLADA